MSYKVSHVATLSKLYTLSIDSYTCYYALSFTPSYQPSTRRSLDDDDGSLILATMLSLLLLAINQALEDRLMMMMEVSTYTVHKFFSV